VIKSAANDFLIDIENIAVGHRQVANAAAIGIYSSEVGRTARC